MLFNIILLVWFLFLISVTSFGVGSWTKGIYVAVCVRYLASKYKFSLQLISMVSVKYRQCFSIFLIQGEQELTHDQLSLHCFLGAFSEGFQDFFLKSVSSLIFVQLYCVIRNFYLLLNSNLESSSVNALLKMAALLLTFIQ